MDNLTWVLHSIVHLVLSNKKENINIYKFLVNKH